MLYLLTGSNGTGKTLFTLKWVREKQIKENRPVCHNGRFDIVEDGELKQWKKIDFKNWQDEPDGTIFVVDECHNDLPNRPTGSAVPEYVKMLAEHRRRGFDFYLMTQHPGNVDSFVRRLIGAPGWHRHLKRVAGGSSMVSCISWDAVNPNCERNGSGATGEVTMMGFPKEVYGWYRSASLHTAKIRIPKQVYIFGAAVVVSAVCAIYAIKTISAKAGVESAPTPAAAAALGTGMLGSDGARNRVMTVAEYLDARKPRLPDLQHTAPVYDQVTQPTVAPYPAACVTMAGTCKCYSQQATVLQVTKDVCLQIVRHGYFVDWQQPQQRPMDQPRHEPVQPAPALAPQQPQVVVVQAPMPQQQPVSEWSQGLAARNAEARSNLVR